jgi:ubiquinone/menaquinone biosynthesis C-methylase UbiE
MNKNRTEIVKKWYEQSYGENGFNAQRLYPNEELLRFLGREFFSKLPRSERKNIKILEVGCGSCSNLWMVAKEGFEAFGVDLSKKSISLGQEMLNYWNVTADLKVGSMTKLPYDDGYFDVIFDVFSANCLDEKSFNICLDEVTRCLKSGGKFFSYSPSIKSDAYINHSPAEKIDQWTIDGIKRIDSAYCGQEYPFHFISSDHYKKLLLERHYNISYLESVGRTYSFENEYFEFITIVGVKKA